MAESWTMNGTVLIACNCDYGCPCNFNALPTAGKCEGEWTWHAAEGAYDGTRLGGVTFTLAVNWPGAIHEGNGEGCYSSTTARTTLSATRSTRS
jgi:hypothetical protein